MIVKRIFVIGITKNKFFRKAAPRSRESKSNNFHTIDFRTFFPNVQFKRIVCGYKSLKKLMLGIFWYQQKVGLDY